jgi:hypothetical protein
MEDGSARYGARILPNFFSVAVFVEPTRMGTRGGNESGLENDLFKISKHL